MKQEARNKGQGDGGFHYYDVLMSTDLRNKKEDGSLKKGPGASSQGPGLLFSTKIDDQMDIHISLTMKGAKSGNDFYSSLHTPHSSLFITQTQINAFERCRRMYYLKYIRKLVWPVETADRGHIREGDDFHLLLRQLILGFPKESLIIPADEPDLENWLAVYCREQPLGNPEQVYAEKEVTLSYANVLWLGKFDALAVTEDRLTIFDWKTGAVQPDRTRYARSPQTRLYRFLARSCASRLLGAGLHAVPAENIEMVYWFPQYPEQTIRLPYSEEEYEEDMTWLGMLAREMQKTEERDYPLTEKTRRCERCEYRSYCFPEIALFPDDAELPDMEEQNPPDELWQAELFLPEIPNDSDREETDF